MKLLLMKLNQASNRLNDLSLLLIRLVLAYGFLNPALMKWKDIPAITDWFASMNYPLPALSTYLAATTEILAVILLPLGFLTRIIALPLMFTMIVAITTVHLGNGFEASANGFEIPLYYLLMLFLLFSRGAGKYSVDALLYEKQ
ncbi:DoxX family protein [Marinilabiliaceae bacterium JC017]|nr:DoxX family protein [Marinilabiliaceae bacterium JC017]